MYKKVQTHTNTNTHRQKRKNTELPHNTKNKKKIKALNNIKKFIEDQHNKKTIRQ